MNKSMMNEMTYYENDDISTIEKAVLAEDLEFTSLDPVLGKFFIPVTTPSIETEEIVTKKNGKFTEANYIELAIPPHLMLMFMKPVMVSVEDFIKQLEHDPKKCNIDCKEQDHKMSKSSKLKFILGFEEEVFIIPKGTEFLIEFLGGHMEIDHMAIIGIYSLTTNMEV